MEKTKKEPLTWDPVRDGDLYCSPACGFGCTWKDYQEAARDANTLKAALGPGWAVRVSENLGWHYSVHRGKCHVFPPRKSFAEYTAYFNIAGAQFIGRGEYPREAVRQAMAQAHLHVADILREIRVVVYGDL